MSKIAIALSGGVDSSLSALLLKEAGHDLLGVCLQMQSDDEGDKVCAGDSAIEAARRSAEYLRIPFEVCDARRAFREKILQYAYEEYGRGRTPCPCVRCNETIKFGLLMSFAKSLGCEKLATGHYARIIEVDGRYYMRRGQDRKKDQSYFLSSLSSESLKDVIFPLGDYCKPEVRALSERYGLPSAKRPDSQNICISRPNMSFAELLWSMFGGQSKEGVFILDGQKLKKHLGIHRYTVGQRHGLGDLVPTKAVWVKGIDREHNVHITTETEALDAAGLWASEWVLHSPSLPERCLVQIRSRHEAAEAELGVEAGRLRILFDKPVRAVTPGQAAVLYLEDRVIARAWIDEPIALKA